ncbi:MAG: FtsX-like permease family protein, partial [Bacteroidota bacterium]
LAPALTQDIPTIEAVARLWPMDGTARVQGGEAFRERFLFADADFFDLFSFPLQRGSPTDALQQPGGVVLSAALASKYFGTTDPVGQPFEVQIGSTYYTHVVTGVAAPQALPSSIQFDILLPYERIVQARADMADDWEGLTVYTFALLRPEATPQQLADPLASIVTRQLGPMLERRGVSPTAIQYQLCGLSDLHFATAISTDHSSLPLGPAPASAQYAYLVLALAIVILLLACLNFVALSTAYTASRGTEVGVRKTLGASRWQVTAQFWGEAGLLAGLGILIGLQLVQVFLPAFNNVLPGARELSFGFWLQPAALALIVGLWLVVTLCAGLYPALVLARFHPVQALKRELPFSGRTFRSGTVLVAVQCAVALLLTIGFFVVRAQVAHLEQRHLNLEGDTVIQVALPNQPGLSRQQAFERFKQTLGTQTGYVSGSSWGTLTDYMPAWGVEPADGDGINQSGDETRVHTFLVDTTYLDVFGHRPHTGHSFATQPALNPAQHIVVNDAFVQRMGVAATVGTTFRLPGYEEPIEIIGVVEDFHHRNVDEVISPTMFVMLSGRSWAAPRYASIRFPAAQTETALSRIDALWRETFPDAAFDYSFYDTQFEQLYRTEQRWQALLQYAALLGIAIGCLGLFGLSALAAGQRRREASIRKVFGAEFKHILALFLSVFARPLLAAAALALPLAYIGALRWLQDFAYRIALSPQHFAVALLIVAGIVLISVGYHAIQIATANPVQVLNQE